MAKDILKQWKCSACGKSGMIFINPAQGKDLVCRQFYEAHESVSPECHGHKMIAPSRSRPATEFVLSFLKSFW